MKYLCATCSRLLDVERFHVEGSVLVVTCVECGGENRSVGPPATMQPPVTAAVPPTVTVPRIVALRTPTVEAISRAASAATEHAFDVPEGHCPKCISKKLPEAPACAICGMVFSQTETGFQPSDWLKEQWPQLLAAWGDDAKHESLRHEALGKGELAEVGRLYRLRLADMPDDPYAVRGRDEVLRLAVLPSLTLRQPQGEPMVPLWKYLALSAVIVACLVVLFFLVRQMLQLS